MVKIKVRKTLINFFELKFFYYQETMENFILFFLDFQTTLKSLEGIIFGAIIVHK